MKLPIIRPYTSASAFSFSTASRVFVFEVDLPSVRINTSRLACVASLTPEENDIYTHFLMFGNLQLLFRILVCLVGFKKIRQMFIPREKPNQNKKKWNLQTRFYWVYSWEIMKSAANLTPLAPAGFSGIKVGRTCKGHMTTISTFTAEGSHKVTLHAFFRHIRTHKFHKLARYVLLKALTVINEGQVIWIEVKDLSTRPRTSQYDKRKYISDYSVSNKRRI